MTEMSDHEQQVYVIQHELGPVKIGIAKNPKRRLTNIQVGSPFELRLRKTATPVDAEAVEKYLHSHFRKYHMRGEWFDIPPGKRDFPIPTHVDEGGNANKDVPLSTDRDIEAEWADALERFFRSYRVTKHYTDNVESAATAISNLVGEITIGSSRRSSSPNPEQEEDELLSGSRGSKTRCSSCGQLYDRTESSCPHCSVGTVESWRHQDERSRRW